MEEDAQLMVVTVQVPNEGEPLRFVVEEGKRSETVGELKRRILENYHESFPLKRKIEEKEVRLKIKNTDFYLTEKIKFGTLNFRKNENDMLEISMEIENDAVCKKIGNAKQPLPVKAGVVPAMTREKEEVTFEKRGEASTLVNGEGWKFRTEEEKRQIDRR